MPKVPWAAPGGRQPARPARPPPPSLASCLAAAGCLVALLTLPSREPPDGE